MALRLLLLWICLPVGPLRSVEISDDFSSGVDTWWSSAGWSLVELSPGQFAYRGDSREDTFAQNGDLNLGPSWRVEVDLRFDDYYADFRQRGLAALALFPSFGAGVQFEANLGHRTNSTVEIDAQWFNTDTWTWHNVLQTGWRASRSPAYRLQLTRPAGWNRLIFQVTSTNGFSYRAETAAIPQDFLDRMKVFGFRVNSSRVDFSNLRVTMPFALPPPPVITEPLTSQTATTGSAVTLRVAASGTGPLTYQWWRGAARLPAFTNDTLTLLTASPAESGTYSVVVSNGDTSATNSASLKVADALLRPGTVSPTGLPLELAVATGREFLVQSSPDLTNWTDLTHSTGTGTFLELTESEPADQPQGFYRIVLP